MFWSRFWFICLRYSLLTRKGENNIILINEFAFFSFNKLLIQLENSIKQVFSCFQHLSWFSILVLLPRIYCCRLLRKIRHVSLNCYPCELLLFCRIWQFLYSFIAYFLKYLFKVALLPCFPIEDMSEETEIKNKTPVMTQNIKERKFLLVNFEKKRPFHITLPVVTNQPSWVQRFIYEKKAWYLEICFSKYQRIYHIIQFCHNPNLLLQQKDLISLASKRSFCVHSPIVDLFNRDLVNDSYWSIE